MAKKFVAGAAGMSQRQLRVGEVVRRALSDVLMRGEIHDPELARHSITVTECRPSPDLRHVTAFITPLGGREEEAALAALQRCKGPLRREVARAVKLRNAPELHFQLDRSFDMMDETNRLLNDPKVKQDLQPE